MQKKDRATLSAKDPLPLSVSPERAEIFHCTLGQMEGFFLFFFYLALEFD